MSSTLTPTAICSSTAFTYTPTSGTTGTTFTWTRAAVANISNAAVTTPQSANPNETLVNTSTAPVNVIYDYTLTANGCTTNQNVTVTVKSSPTLSSTLTPTAICSSTAFTYTPTSGTTGTTFTWTRAAVANISNAAVTTAQSANPNETLVNTSAAPVNVIYLYALTANGCANNQNVTIKVNPTPKVINKSSIICSGTSFTIDPINNIMPGEIVPVNTNYTWPIPIFSGVTGLTNGSNLSIISSVLGFNGTAPINVTYNVTATSPTSPSCSSNFNVIVTLKPLPSIPSIAPDEAFLNNPANRICQNSYQTLSASISSTNSSVTPNVNNVIYSWSTLAPTIIKDSSSFTIPKYKNAVYKFDGISANIQVKVTVLEPNGCSNLKSINITPLGTPSNDAVIYNGNDFVCLNNTPVTYAWGTDDRNFVSTNAPGSITTQNWSTPNSSSPPNTFVWVITKTGCTSKTYFIPPGGRSAITQPPVSQTQPIKISPNPANNEAVITWAYSSSADAAAITITDVLGKKVLVKSIPGGSAVPGRAVVNVAGLQRGIYLVNVFINTKKTATGKLVKE